MLKGCGFHAASPRGSRKGVIFMSVRVEEEEEEGGKIGTVTREKLTTALPALLPRRKDRLIGWTVATLQMRFRRQRQYNKCEIHPTNLVGTACIFAGTKARVSALRKLKRDSCVTAAGACPRSVPVWKPPPPLDLTIIGGPHRHCTAPPRRGRRFPGSE